MGRRAPWLAVAAGALGTFGAAGGCTLLTSLDGLSDGAALGEAGPAATEGGGADAPSVKDGSAGDEGLPADGGDAAVISRYASAVLADGPLLYYRFGEKSGSPARDEVSGATTPYPVAGITYGTPGHLAGDPDTAVTTDGTGALQLTQIADFDGLNPFSVEAWVSPSPAGNDTGFLVDHEVWTTRGGWDLRVSKSDYGFERWGSVGGAAPTSNSIGASIAAVAGEWHHVVATNDGTTQRLYVDGARVDMGVVAIDLVKLGQPFSVGKQNCIPCLGTGFVGIMDELAIYPKALAEDRILAHVAAAR